jgi:PhnB protein
MSNEQPVSEGMHTVTPHLVCSGAAKAIEFYKKAFNAIELARVPGKENKLLHGCIRIGNSKVMLVDEFPEMTSSSPKSLKGTPVTIHLQVENADAVFDQAVKTGAMIKMPMKDMFWGDRYGLLEDPFGHRWSIATHIREASQEEMQQAVMNQCG